MKGVTQENRNSTGYMKRNLEILNSKIKLRIQENKNCIGSKKRKPVVKADMLLEFENENGKFVESLDSSKYFY